MAYCCRFRREINVIPTVSRCGVVVHYAGEPPTLRAEVSIMTDPTKFDGRHPTTETGAGITAVEQIDHFASDYDRAMFYRRHAESHRDEWMAGRRREIAYVMNRAKVGDARFKRMPPNELEVIGRWRWSRSAEAHRLANQEQMFRRWAHMYLEFAKFSPPTEHS
jgi:hypothetical protein